MLYFCVELQIQVHKKQIYLIKFPKIQRFETGMYKKSYVYFDDNVYLILKNQIVSNKTLSYRDTNV